MRALLVAFVLALIAVVCMVVLIATGNADYQVDSVRGSAEMVGATLSIFIVALIVAAVAALFIRVVRGPGQTPALTPIVAGTLAAMALTALAAAGYQTERQVESQSDQNRR